jgi:hypothetical protein
MTAQQRKTGKNYRAPARDREQRIAGLAAAAKHCVLDHVIGLMAVTVRRRSEAR